MKREYGIAAILLPVCILAGCAQKENILTETGREKKTELVIYCSGEDITEASELEKIARKFMENYEDIEVRLEFSETGIYSEELKIKLAQDEMPDIMQIQDAEEWVQAGMFGEMPAEISELLEETYSYEGIVYAVPMYRSTNIMIYNRVIFKKYGISVPQNYDEFLEACSVLKGYGVTPLAVGGSRMDNLTYWFNYFFQKDVVSENPQWILDKKEGKVSFTDENISQMLVDYTELLGGEYVLEDSINMSDEKIVTHLLKGDVAMLYAGPWMFNKLMQADPESAYTATDNYGNVLLKDTQRFRIGSFLMPDNENGCVAMDIIGPKWAISAECCEDMEKYSAAAEFLAFFYRKDNYREFLQSLNGFRTTQTAVRYPIISAQNDVEKEYRYAAKSKVYFGNEDTPGEFSNHLYEILYSLVSGTISVDSAQERLESAWVVEED